MTYKQQLKNRIEGLKTQLSAFSNNIGKMGGLKQYEIAERNIFRSGRKLEKELKSIGEGKDIGFTYKKLI